MAANYVLLEKITVGAAGAASVTFSSIPQTGYTDLDVKMSARSTRASTQGDIYIYPNGSSANGSDRTLVGTGSAVSSGTDASIYAGTITASTAVSSSAFSNNEFYFPNYTSASYKSISIDSVAESNEATMFAWLIAGLWSNTAAITSLQIVCGNSSNFTQYSTFYLYGVAKYGTTPAISPYATGGDTIMTDGTYWYHTFKATGIFTPLKALTCDVLVVAGGGGGNTVSGVGSSNRGGGGGAGGLLYSASQSVSSAQTVTVGAGGSRGVYPSTYSTNGVNSQFGSITASVGGGTSNVSAAASSGGSGGGGNEGFNGGAGTSGQGNAGANGSAAGSLQGGGGGGAGAAGSSTTGGNGVSTYSSWATATGTGANGGYYAGGGAGAPSGGAGLGGGGTGGGASDGGAGTANTGGGGGGSGSSANGGAGGSGIVIVRYAV